MERPLLYYFLWNKEERNFARKTWLLNNYQQQTGQKRIITWKKKNCQTIQKIHHRGYIMHYDAKEGKIKQETRDTGTDRDIQP